MPEEIINKKIAKELMGIKGEGRGLASKDDLDYVRLTYGEAALKKVEQALADLGYPIKYKEIKSMNFYPLGQEALVLLTIKKVLGFDDEKLKEVGSSEAKQSLIVRLFMKYFVSLEKAAQEAPKMWGKYYTVGRIKVEKLDPERKQGFIKVEDFHLHPIHCAVLKGYFPTILKMIVNSPVTCEEIKCPFRGDDYHYYSLKWK